MPSALSDRYEQFLTDLTKRQFIVCLIIFHINNHQGEKSDRHDIVRISKMWGFNPDSHDRNQLFKSSSEFSCP